MKDLRPFKDAHSNRWIDEMMRTAIQFVAMLAAALLGEYVSRVLTRMPMSSPYLWFYAVHWSAVGLAYLLPRSATRSVRTRILGSLLLISALAVTRTWFAWHLRAPLAIPVILAPLPAIVVLCVAASVTAPPRSATRLVFVLLAAVAVQFLFMWWSYDFQTEFLLRVTAAQLIPLVAAAFTLLVSDNLIERGVNPTDRSTVRSYGCAR